MRENSKGIDGDPIRKVKVISYTQTLVSFFMNDPLHDQVFRPTVLISADYRSIMTDR